MKRITLKLFPTRRTVWLVVYGTFLAVVLGCGDAEEPVQTAAPGAKKARVPEQQFFGYRLIESEAGIRQWVLQSEKMLKFTTAHP